MTSSSWGNARVYHHLTLEKGAQPSVALVPFPSSRPLTGEERRGQQGLPPVAGTLGVGPALVILGARASGRQKPGRAPNAPG